MNLRAAPASLEAGRVCPADYRYSPSVFDRAPDFESGILYVVGGLYGNLNALDEIERMAAAEIGPVTIVLNGDFHWFDADPDWFAAVEARTSKYRALRGNVETEIARPDDIGAGCGCAYPASVSHDIVTRSNAILAQLRGVAQKHPGAPQRLAALPAHLVAQVGNVRVGIVHGDAHSLAGWGFTAEHLDGENASGVIAELRRASNIGVFASTHTCLALLRDFATPDGRLSIINNGAAGMPNFAGARAGLISRIATNPSPHAPAYAIARDGVFIDALPVAYDHAAFRASFCDVWDTNSPAALSYGSRIDNGPGYTIAAARPRNVPALSIILPVLNEARSIAASLDALVPARAQGCEIIVADGGSNDATATIATPLCDRIVHASCGRASQMNAGAQVARADTLLFLHADTRLPDDFPNIIADALTRTGRQWGRFDIAIDGAHPMLPVVAAAMNARSRATGIATGDQAIFATRDAFARIGGFPAIALMEDVGISKRLKALGPPVCLTDRAKTSGRRWEKNGVWRTIALMWRLRLAYFFGTSPEKLAARYGYSPTAGLPARD